MCASKQASAVCSLLRRHSAIACGVSQCRVCCQVLRLKHQGRTVTEG